MQRALAGGWVRKVGNGIPGVASSYYEPTQKLVTLSIPPPTPEEIERKLNAVKRTRAATRKAIPILAFVEESARLLALPMTEEVRRLAEDKVRGANVRATLAAIESGNFEAVSSFAKTTVIKPINNLNKTVIPQLRMDGQQTFQADIQAAHPSVVPRLLFTAGDKYGAAGALDESRRMIDELESGRIYDAVARAQGLDGGTAKRKLLSAFNGRHGHHWNCPIMQAFREHYPIAGQVMARIRHGEHSRLSRHLAGIVADAVNESLRILMRQGIPAIPRTDEIICRDSDAATVREIMQSVFFDRSMTNAKVGGARVSFIPTEEEVEELGRLRVTRVESPGGGPQPATDPQPDQKKC